MRIASERIKLVMVDEPTSAMDPEGELHLFDGLREMQNGKTMIFVTHRFGHLTKHADLILYVVSAPCYIIMSDGFELRRCMKDGELVEQGTHEELVAKRGEYFKLRDVQARAFV